MKQEIICEKCNGKNVKKDGVRKKIEVKFKDINAAVAEKDSVKKDSSQDSEIQQELLLQRSDEK